MLERRILSILLHVGDWRAATDWYQRAFPEAKPVLPSTDDYGHLEMGGVVLKIVNADDKVTSGAAGTVVYWVEADLDAGVLRLGLLGASLNRGPLALEGSDLICQVRGLWG